MKIPHEINLYNYELIISEDCNLRCKYCFDGYSSDRTNKCLPSNIMNAEIIPNLLLFIDKTKRKKFNVNLFGGEPLFNWTFFKQIVIELRKKYGFEDLTISTVTNGTLLDTEKISFIKKNDIGISVSIDGIKEANILRVDKNNNETWDKIVKILPELCSKVENINLKMVLNKENYKFLYNSYKFLSTFRREIEILVDFHNDWLNEDVLKHIENDYEKLFIEDRLPLFSSLNRYKASKGKTFCAMAENSISINPLGEIFFCHQFVPKLNSGQKKEKFGNIVDGFINTKKFKEFNSRCNFSEWSKTSKCNDCDLKSWCKGNCIAEHYHYNNSYDLNNINENICKYNRMLSKKLLR